MSHKCLKTVFSHSRIDTYLDIMGHVILNMKMRDDDINAKLTHPNMKAIPWKENNLMIIKPGWKKTLIKRQTDKNTI